MDDLSLAAAIAAAIVQAMGKHQEAEVVEV